MISSKSSRICHWLYFLVIHGKTYITFKSVAPSISKDWRATTIYSKINSGSESLLYFGSNSHLKTNSFRPTSETMSQDFFIVLIDNVYFLCFTLSRSPPVSCGEVYAQNIQAGESSAI